MTFLELCLLAIALSVDAFSVGAVVGLRHRSRRQVFRIAFHFGLFQALFPWLSALASRLFLDFIDPWDHWIVFTVLGIVGLRMVWEALRGEEHRREAIDLTRGFKLIGLSTAVSIDAAAAGLVITTSNTPLLPSVALIGTVTMLATTLAMLGARRLSSSLGKRAEVMGGIVLMLLGTRVLLSGLGIIAP
ncbi:MAG TPA: manganese efflux pump MntP family protein [Polyangiaceae bacterium]|nr:MAG: putative manganese efflux pump MntP [Deltaproteobacteria bacterium ADurb.Bin207]HNZ21786.1 manganese efflux pump MntP family protein [Polyangiaceae bacterium]HOD23490.1 manganese efflux pump MntP family protein [Polyangiaceae bacterium]HOE51509.1 manganese efflux pump MntP family protein [Polyangiaceae bacterium]HOG99653.1 manganese efflux pump MntP family protein [Polyangiaceae bacterium]